MSSRFFCNILLILLATLYVTIVTGQEGVPCHKDIFQITPRHSLNIPLFMGDWYMQEYAGSHIGNVPPPNYKCLKLSFNLTDPTDILHFQANEEFIELESGLTVTDTSYITVNDGRSPLSSIWELTNTDGSIRGSQILLFTDLEFGDWSIIYSCQIRGENAYRWETVSIYTRNQTISDELRHTLKALTIGFGFRTNDHHPVDQNGCSN